MQPLVLWGFLYVTLSVNVLMKNFLLKKKKLLKKKEGKKIYIYIMQ